MAADYADDIALIANTPTQAKYLLHCLEWAVGGIGLHVNTDKTEYIYYKTYNYRIYILQNNNYWKSNKFKFHIFLISKLGGALEELKKHNFFILTYEEMGKVP